MTRKDVPNLLTYLRLVLAVATLCGLLAGAYLAALLGETGRAAALVFASLAAFVIAALTDFFDGWLARRWDAGSAWGATLDPIADKLAVTAAVLGLLVLLPRPAIAAVGAVILFREVLVSGLREYLAELKVGMPVSRVAKWKTAFQLVAVGVLIAGPAGEAILPGTIAVGLALLWLAAALTIYTGWDYLKISIDHAINGTSR